MLKRKEKMNIDALNEVKDRYLQNDLSKGVEVNNLNKNMNDLSEKLQTYLENNKEPNREDKRFDIPIDFEMDVGKNELGNTTILGKITIEKSAMKDLEKLQDKAESVKYKAVAGAKSGLNKVYDIVKDTFIEKAADKVLNTGSKVWKMAIKTVGYIGRKILKI